MTKRKKFSLEELSYLLPVLNEIEQMEYIGGGIGTHDDPYSVAEWMYQVLRNDFYGGWVYDGISTKFFGQYDNVEWNQDQGMATFDVMLPGITVYADYQGGYYADYTKTVEALDYIYNHKQDYYGSTISMKHTNYMGQDLSYQEIVTSEGSTMISAVGTTFDIGSLNEIKSEWVRTLQNTDFAELINKTPNEVKSATTWAGRALSGYAFTTSVIKVFQHEATPSDYRDLISSGLGLVGSVLIDLPIPQAKVAGVVCEGLSVVISIIPVE
ncbi:MAG: hypothetical protein PUG09_07570 [Prevotella sp.]|nr:hypothetical protein [Prevotella sp.]